MTSEEKVEFAKLLQESRPKPLSNFPGGAPGATLALALLVFIAKDYFGDFKQSSIKLQEVQTNQLLIQETLNRVEEAMSDMEKKMADRYTGTDAAKDLAPLQRQITNNTGLLTEMSNRFSSIESRLDRLEFRSEEFDNE